MISSISGMSGGMAAMQGARPARPSQEELFNSIDADGDGSVNATEMKTMAEQLADKMGDDAPSVEELLANIDSNGDGAMSFAEFEAGRPQGPPPGAGQGPPPGGMPPGVTFGTSGEMDLSSLFGSSEEEDSSTYETLYA